MPDTDSLRRPLIVGTRGAVSTCHPLATSAGLEILWRGGNAFDAAVAIAAALGVVEPLSCGAGGDVLALCYDARRNETAALNAAGAAPLAAHPREYASGGIPVHGIRSATVPAAVDGWLAVLERYGTLPASDVFAPAIAYAEEGYPAGLHDAHAVDHYEPLLAADPGAASFPGGTAARGGRPHRAARPRRDAAGDRPRRARRVLRGHVRREPAAAIARRRRAVHEGGLRAGARIVARPGGHRLPRVHRLRPAARVARVHSPRGAQHARGVRSPRVRPEHRAARALHDRDQEPRVCRPSRLRRRPRAGADPARHPAVEALRHPAPRRLDLTRAATAVPPGPVPAAPGSDTTYFAVGDREGDLVSFMQSLYRGSGPA